MSDRLEFISLGEQVVAGVPLRCVPLAEPNAGALYRRKLEALYTSTAEYLCFVDGFEDVCLPGFVDAMQRLADRGLPIGYAAEIVHGKAAERAAFSLPAFISDHSIIHHGVVCRREALLGIDWPAGCYSWEVIAHGTLAQQGFVFDPAPHYDWRPGPGGARLWPSNCRAIANSKRHLQGLPGVNFPKDF